MRTKRDRLASVNRKPPYQDQERRYQFLVLPTCPDCGSTDAVCDGTSRKGDEAITRIFVCCQCGRSWYGIFEKYGFHDVESDI